ncbi:MAG: hypothetical protein JSV16_07320, partial [Candidatus Hydrogenedentota bacterium]
MMTTWKLIFLRLFNITLGRAECLSRALRKILERALITGKQDKYVASSKFFDMKDLKEHPDELRATKGA